MTPKDSYGLNVCLNTLVGYSANPTITGNGKSYSDTYIEKSGNPIFLNIKMTPKAEKDADG